jgi:hypothetical protein
MTRTTVFPYVNARAGLGDIPGRLRRAPCTIAYMGASVTAQKDGYRPRLHELLSQATGHDHRAVPAGLGAMGAITGVFLMDELVLPRRPDLTFVEYATSDIAGTTPPEHLGAVLEGIVGKLRAAGSEPCFLYLHRADMRLGSSPIVDTYERVADAHGVPSINVAEWMREAIDRGAVAADAVLRDVVHTTAAGSDLTAGAIRAALAELPEAPRPARVTSADAGYGSTRVVPATPALAANGPVGEARFRLSYPYVEIDRRGLLRFRPDGELVGLLVIVGPHSGYIELASPAGRSEHLLWDEECSYERLGSVILEPFVPAGAEVTIRLSSRPVDESGAKRTIDPALAARKLLKLVGLLVRP